MTNYTEEIHTILDTYGTEKHRDGFIEGYAVALNDFYNALKHTHMTPDEIIKKLSLD